MRMTSRGAPGNKGTTTHCTDRDLVSIAASLHEERPCLRIRIHGDRDDHRYVYFSLVQAPLP